MSTPPPARNESGTRPTPPSASSGRISRGALDTDALKVVGRLRRHGHTAYFVGGCVRDLLLGRQPKDYDVGTTARPRQVKQLFRNSRIIGRRFRLVHVVFGRKVIEVATFRSQEEPEENGNARPDDLLIRSDNVYGTPEEDAFRRDFTVNGLFYEPEAGDVIDFVEGLPDLDSRVIRTIGDPAIRLREDPVRMIRAVKFAARLGFALEPATYDALVRHREEIARSAAPRIAEEVVRLARGGHALESFRLLHDVGLFGLILPRVHEAIAFSPLFWKRLAQVDRVPGGAGSLTRPTLLAVVYSPIFDAIAAGEEPGRARDTGALFTKAIRPVVTERLLSRREADRIKQILVAQRRLASDPQGRRAGHGGRRRRRRRSPVRNLVRRDYFREALAYFKLDAMAKGLEPHVWERWEEFLPQAPQSEEINRWKKKEAREAAQAMGESGGSGRRRRRRRRRGRGGEEAEETTGETPVTPRASEPAAEAKPRPKPKPEPEPRVPRIADVMPVSDEPLINPYTGKPYAPRESKSKSAESKAAAESAARPAESKAATESAARPAESKAATESAGDDVTAETDAPNDDAPRRRRRRRKKKGVT